MNKDCAGEKKALRNKILSLRDALSHEERHKKSAAIQSHLFSLPEFIAARTIALFVSCRSEVLTEAIIESHFPLGKQQRSPLPISPGNN